MSNTSSAAAEVILRRMSDVGDSERHSDGVEGPSGRSINRFVSQNFESGFLELKKGCVTSRSYSSVSIVLCVSEIDCNFE